MVAVLGQFGHGHFGLGRFVYISLFNQLFPEKCITHAFMHAHTPTHNLWLWPKRPPLAFSVAEMSVAEMSGPKLPRPKCPRPKCPTFVVAPDPGGSHQSVFELNIEKKTWLKNF